MPENLIQYACVIYPNPANRTITVRVPSNNSEEHKITIVNMLGEMVYQSELIAGQSEKTIDLPGISEGIYQLIATSATNRFTQKLLITRWISPTTTKEIYRNIPLL